MSTLSSRNPATGEILGEAPLTPVSDLPEVFRRARVAQEAWSVLPIRRRAAILQELKEALLDEADGVADLISKENGKPPFEALSGELLPAVATIDYFAKKAPRLLKNRPIRLGVLPHRRSYLTYWPMCTLVVISPWNFPFHLPFTHIVLGLLAGNAVVLKPSELTPLTGLKIQDLVDKAGLPSNLLQTVIGDASLGSALVEARPAKIFFIGSVATGKSIMRKAADNLTPVNLELGGKDPMIVLPDADIDFASSAALWGAFSNAGQVCASTERIIVHHSIADAFLKSLREKAEKLRVNPRAQVENDIGAITSEQQKAIYEKHLAQAVGRGATVMTGGELSSDRATLRPTIVTGDQIESLDVYRQETFGPIVAVTQYRNLDEAIRKANDSTYGLAASVIGRNLRQADRVARSLEAGTVAVNEVLYTAGIPETPWGGVKDSGVGRSRSDLGLYEYVNTRHIHKPASKLFVFKSPWWFPYTAYQYATFKKAMELYRTHFSDRLRAFPLFIWHLVRFLKRDRRF